MSEQNTEKRDRAKNIHKIIQQARHDIEGKFADQPDFIEIFDLIIASFAASGMRAFVQNSEIDSNKTVDIMQKGLRQGATQEKISKVLDNVFFLKKLTKLTLEIHQLTDSATFSTHPHDETMELKVQRAIQGIVSTSQVRNQLEDMAKKREQRS
jgi:hypothetical protein